MNFKTWRCQGRQYVAVDNGDGWHVIREDGANYGAWRSADAFRKLQRANDPDGFVGLPGTVAALSVRVRASDAIRPDVAPLANPSTRRTTPSPKSAPDADRGSPAAFTLSPGVKRRMAAVRARAGELRKGAEKIQGFRETAAFGTAMQILAAATQGGDALPDVPVGLTREGATGLAGHAGGQ